MFFSMANSQATRRLVWGLRFPFEEREPEPCRMDSLTSESFFSGLSLNRLLLVLAQVFGIRLCCKGARNEK